ncbi:MAG: NAD-dependent epimerase/dehydratase family protein [Acidimicrobiales bacterium]
MRIVVTGATGFVGRYTVAAALARGHRVAAVLRPASSGRELGPLLDHPGVEAVRVDLRSRAGLVDAVRGADSVIHLAAAKSGDFYTQFAGTVVATENLLWAMGEAGVGQLVAVSTFSVYDYKSLDGGTLLTETSPIDADPVKRDEYARTKLLQEELYREFGSHGAVPDPSPEAEPQAPEGRRAVIVRPGLIYGRDELWHALLGAELGPRFLRVGAKATLPLLYVENCAEALVLAAEKLAENPSLVSGETINLVDDDLPTQGRYVELVTAVMEPPPSLFVPWPVMRLAADALDRANGLLLGGRAKFPGIVVPEKLHGRFKPLRYTNAKAKRLLGWTPRYGTEDAVRRAGGDADLLSELASPAGSQRAHG